MIESPEWTSLCKQATMAVHIGKFEVAQQKWLQALEIAALFHPRDPRLPQTLDNLTNLYLARGQYDKAEAFARQTLEKTKQVYGNLHSKVASSLNTIAGIYFSQNLQKKAEPFCLQALEVYTQIYSADHPDLGMAHNNLALVYHAQGKLKLAKQHYESALPIRVRILGTYHPSMQVLLDNYLDLLQNLGEEGTVTSIRQTRANGVEWRMFDSEISLPKHLVA
jgi:tetratricopeptide (TPR) repeat protein